MENQRAIILHVDQNTWRTLISPCYETKKTTAFAGKWTPSTEMIISNVNHCTKLTYAIIDYRIRNCHHRNYSNVDFSHNTVELIIAFVFTQNNKKTPVATLENSRPNIIKSSEIEKKPLVDKSSGDLNVQSKNQKIKTDKSSSIEYHENIAIREDENSFELDLVYLFLVLHW